MRAIVHKVGQQETAAGEKSAGETVVSEVADSVFPLISEMCKIRMLQVIKSLVHTASTRVDSTILPSNRHPLYSNVSATPPLGQQAKTILKRLGEEEDAKRKVVEAEERERRAREEKNQVKKSGGSTQPDAGQLHAQSNATALAQALMKRPGPGAPAGSSAPATGAAATAPGAAFPGGGASHASGAPPAVARSAGSVGQVAQPIAQGQAAAPLSKTKLRGGMIELRDMVFVLERDRRLRRSSLMYQSLLRFDPKNGASTGRKMGKGL